VTLPLPLTWPWALPFWLLVGVVFYPEARVDREALAMARAQRAQDRGSMFVIFVLYRLAVLAGFAAALLIPGATVVHGKPAFFAVGMLSLAAGGLLRWHCRRMLGRHFTGAVKVVPDQPVIERGAYRLVRHPSYTAGMLVMLGFGFALTNWVALPLVVLLTAAAYARRVQAEERALLETLGEPYRQYMQRTKRFIPKLL
jgi:protein-S-isoprenylcysteine O-methyltransferase Ste14